MMVKIIVSQDGRDFYWSEDGGIRAPKDLVKGDWDLEGAEKARAWFVEWCAQKNYEPVFACPKDLEETIGGDLTPSEREILQEIAGERPARPWGAHVGVCLEFLHGRGYITACFGGELTQRGRDALAAIGGAQ